MTWCNDRWRHQREGEDAARRDPGARYDREFRERERTARYEPHGCDAAFVRGFEDQVRRDELEREEREAAEERARAGRFSDDPPDDDSWPEPDDGPDEGEDLTPSERATIDELRTVREQLEQQLGVDGAEGEDVPF